MGTVVRTVQPKGEGLAGCTIIDSASKIIESYADYLTDESGFGPSSAERLVFARSEKQIALVLKDVYEREEPVTVSAGRTGIVGGAVPTGGTLLSLAEMNNVIGIRRLPDGRLALTAEPGITIAELNDRVARKELGIATGLVTQEQRSELEAFVADDHAYFYPPDPTEDTAHLGATVATNASGARSFYYGATREHVHRLRICLSNGEVIDVERGVYTAADGKFEVVLGDGRSITVKIPSYSMPETKNAAGYFVHSDVDLIDLFIASEGTLGVITEVEVVPRRRPVGILSALAFFGSDNDAIEFVRQARGDLDDQPRPGAVVPMALEFFDSRSFDFLRRRKEEGGESSNIPELPDGARAGVLFEQEFEDEDSLMAAYEGWEELLDGHGSSMEQTWGGMEESDLAKLRALRHSIAEEVNGVIARAKAKYPEIHKIGTDIAVPHDRLMEMFAYYRDTLAGMNLEYVIFGHIGDSHLHLNIMPVDPDQLRVAEDLALQFARQAVKIGGTVSAEHGIGKLKHEFLEALYGEDGLREMAVLKRTFDPSGMLNRGVMFSSDLLT